MNLANRSLGLSVGVIELELYSPYNSARMRYAGTGRNEADAAMKFRTALVGSQTLHVRQDACGGYVNCRAQ